LLYAALWFSLYLRLGGFDMSEIDVVVHLVVVAGETKEIVHVIDGSEGYWLDLDRLPGGVADAFRAAEK